MSLENDTHHRPILYQTSSCLTKLYWCCKVCSTYNKSYGSVMGLLVGAKQIWTCLYIFSTHTQKSWDPYKSLTSAEEQGYVWSGGSTAFSQRHLEGGGEESIIIISKSFFLNCEAELDRRRRRKERNLITAYFDRVDSLINFIFFAQWERGGGWNTYTLLHPGEKGCCETEPAVTQIFRLRSFF